MVIIGPQGLLSSQPANPSDIVIGVCGARSVWLSFHLKLRVAHCQRGKKLVLSEPARSWDGGGRDGRRDACGPLGDDRAWAAHAERIGIDGQG